MSKFLCPDKMDWAIAIKRVSNGFVVQESSPDEEVKIEETVFQFKESCDNDLEALQSLLYHIKDFLGFNYSKHNLQNIEINIVENKE